MVRPAVSSHPRHGRTTRVCHRLVRLQVISSNLGGHGQSQRVTQHHGVGLFHRTACKKTDRELTLNHLRVFCYYFLYSFLSALVLKHVLTPVYNNNLWCSRRTRGGTGIPRRKVFWGFQPLVAIPSVPDVGGGKPTRQQTGGWGNKFRKNVFALSVFIVCWGVVILLYLNLATVFVYTELLTL